MKRIFISLLIMIWMGIFQSCFALENIFSLDDIPVSEKQSEFVDTDNSDTTLDAVITFDWLDISQAQRDEQIQKYKDLLFEDNKSKIYYTKEEYNSTFKKYKKDKEYKYHYMLTNNGVTEDEDAKYCAFYYKKNTLVMYAIQYKDNPRRAFYYTAFGKLYYTDVMSDEYPNFPYTSMQYDRKGQLKSAIYFISKDLQYMYGPDKEFQGLWYKDKMYDKNGKQTLTRSNW